MVLFSGCAIEPTQVPSINITLVERIKVSALQRLEILKTWGFFGTARIFISGGQVLVLLNVITHQEL